MLGGNLVGARRGAVDRISELPDFIKHMILTNLDTKEACRASVLSKGWYVAWLSIPVLDFRPEYFGVAYNLDYVDEKVQNFVGFIDKTMQRYLMNKYQITRLYLELPNFHENKTFSLIDKWIMIAVQNKIQNMEIFFGCGEYEHTLPEILFRAKSLEVLKCRGFALPYYKTMELISLEYLTLYIEYVDANMLQRIISLCPLVELDITMVYPEIFSSREISLPWMRKVNSGVEGRDSETLQSNLRASPLQKFIFNVNYYDIKMDFWWPWKMNVVALKNLRKLEIVNAGITDDIVSELAYGLVALESLVLDYCRKLKCIKISSISLKKFQLIDCSQLTKVIIDTPNLLEFWCGCGVETSVSSIRTLDECIAQFCPSVYRSSINTSWLVKLNSFLLETNLFESLVIEMHRSPEIEVEEEQLRNVISSPPYKLKELKLRRISDHNSTSKFILAFLYGVFWCCHPDVLSVTTDFSNPATKSILDVLKHFVKCWKHPLKHVEFEGIDGLNILSELSEIEFRFRLSWR